MILLILKSVDIKLLIIFLRNWFLIPLLNTYLIMQTLWYNFTIWYFYCFIHKKIILIISAVAITFAVLLCSVSCCSDITNLFRKTPKETKANKESDKIAENVDKTLVNLNTDFALKIFKGLSDYLREIVPTDIWEEMEERERQFEESSLIDWTI